MAPTPRAFRPALTNATPPESGYPGGWAFTSSVKRYAIREARQRRGHVHQNLAGSYPGYRYTVCTDTTCDLGCSPKCSPKYGPADFEGYHAVGCPNVGGRGEWDR